MSILALDLGTTTGLAVFEKGGVLIISGYHCLKEKKHQSIGKRYHYFLVFLETLYLNYGISQVVYERVNRHMGTQAAHVYGAFEGLLQMFCSNTSLPLDAYSVTEIKKTISNNGRASKKEIINAVNQYLSIKIKNDNEADAIAVGLTHFKKTKGE